jgi:hypothetical protein
MATQVTYNTNNTSIITSTRIATSISAIISTGITISQGGESPSAILARIQTVHPRIRTSSWHYYLIALLQKRPIAQPNPGDPISYFTTANPPYFKAGFMSQLNEFHQQLAQKGQWRSGGWVKP